MSQKIKKEVQNNLFKGQKYKFQGYPQWYNEQLALNRPIPVSRFEGDLHQATYFYEHQSEKLHFANHVLKVQLEAVMKQIHELKYMVQDVEEQENSSAEEKKRRVRRCASQIERKYVCPVPNCQKSYGTEGSMAQHMRLKHPDVNYVMADLNPDPITSKEEVSAVKKQQKLIKKDYEQ